MKGVDTIARIRREFSVRGKTIKEIVRELHVSRNTVRKVLRSGATSFEYEREVQPLPKIGPWKADLEPAMACLPVVGRAFQSWNVASLIPCLRHAPLSTLRPPAPAGRR